MKLSLPSFRHGKLLALGAAVGLLSNGSASPEDLVLQSITDLGLKITFEQPTNGEPAKADIQADNGKVANKFGVPASATGLRELEGPFGSLKSVQALQDQVKAGIRDGELSFVLDDKGGTRISIPTESGAKALAEDYGLRFKLLNNKVVIGAVTGTAKQSRLREGDEVESVDEETPETVLQAYAFFYRAIHQSGQARIQADDRQFVVPESPGAPGLRGVADSRAPHVAFPPFVGPGTRGHQEADAKSSRNEVISARVETYYFRDAHRLAQILNRGVKSYQAAAVSLQERAAENARDGFDTARSRRRELEFRAEQSARELRQKKEELRRLVDSFRNRLDGGRGSKSELEKELARLTHLRTSRQDEKLVLKEDTLTELAASIAAKEEAFNDTPESDTSGRAAIAREVSDLQRQHQTATSRIAELEKSIAELDGVIVKQAELIKGLQPGNGTSDDSTPNSETLRTLVEEVKSLEQKVADDTLRVRKAEEAELTAAKSQFRAEVAAAKADPDTYVPADLKSVDPVTQVSISVIGEGVLHLRGPRQGVVTLRDMINQLDHPVGQVKIGIMTVQLNGEQGARMENTLRRMEGHLSRGRFLTYVSEQLLKRAIAETASEVAEQAKMSGLIDGVGISENTYRRHLHDPARLQRWHAYVSAFFGRDFLEGLKDVDPNTPVLDPLNKLLSLSSADSLTLAEAMFVTGLAKHSVRSEIVRKFREALVCDLPQKDLQWIKVNGIKKGWNPIWWGDDCTNPERVMQHAAENYTFAATTSFFRRDYREDSLNPLQREVIRLVQGLALERWLAGQRRELGQKRELVRQMASVDEKQKLTPAEQFLVDSEIARLTEAHLDAQEAVRGRKAALDRLIKQIVIAVEDDCYAQYYGPAMERIRRATTEWDVELGSVERTTILTNNRAFGKVAPQATYQFDLPKRDILLAEAMQAAYALHRDLGPLAGDPNFATLTKMFAGQSTTGSSVDGTIKNVLPGLDSSADQKNLLYADSTQPEKFGTELEKLIPDPAIYKFETGTGFEVRPVVQPDGQSVVFDFNYMYTTDLLEPTSPDERSLGRVKRHFVDTEVQIGNLEWREISRYEISLKAARNSRGVPLLEDIPVVGLAFRPLPQAKKSIQKNIIIGQAAVYPTIEDLLGLRSPAAAGLPVQDLGADLDRLREVQTGTNRAAKTILGEKASKYLPSVGTTTKFDSSDSPRLALPAPVRQFGYEVPSTVSGQAPRLLNPGKPVGSVPADVSSPRPSRR